MIIFPLIFSWLSSELNDSFTKLLIAANNPPCKISVFEDDVKGIPPSSKIVIAFGIQKTS